MQAPVSLSHATDSNAQQGVSQLYVLGHPVAHSKSPAMHNAAYAVLGLPWHYGFMDCPEQQQAHDFLLQDEWLAVNITMPYKPLALQAAQRASDDAQLAQGANVLIRRPDGSLYADNTDGRGCISYLQRCGVRFPGASVVICGTGPTSQAIMHAASKAGAARIHLLGRDSAKAQRALDGYFERLGGIPGMPCQSALISAGSYDTAQQAIAQADVIIDATPLGMNAGDPAPFDTDLLHAGQTVFDVVYGHGETALMAAARQAGCQAFDGAGMLVAQAVLTVYDIADELAISVDPRSVDLFDTMAQAADFTI